MYTIFFHPFERFGYPVYMLKLLTEQLGKKQILVHYDVGCQLEKHLKVCEFIWNLHYKSDMNIDLLS